MPSDRTAEFRELLSQPRPPPGLAAPLVALWHAGRGEWDHAHRIAMRAKGRDAAWVHAYLHRQEGDLDNARYWYRKAHRPEADCALEKEWAAIVAALLERG